VLAMAYVLSQGPERDRRWRHRPFLLVASVVALVALLLAAFLLGRNGAEGDREGFPPTALAPPLITWTHVGSQPVPASPTHGPAETGSGMAAGFTQTELGAVLAAINISTRLSATVGPVIYESTARLQCVGDREATIASIRSQRSNSTPGSTTPREVFYRITSGTPSSRLVAVSIAVETPQSISMGGYAELSRTVQWIDGDWKLLVPPPPPQLITSVDGYTSLGQPNG
jgi:hypothetical protein